MSGDVQPRKRKEKRRKKDDEDAGTPPPTLINPAESSTDNVTIHIYKESSTGGHWCARIVFFVLLAILVGLVGIIIFEHRGTTDVDTPLESSRWAFVFDGWVDDSPPSHDEEPDDEKEHAEASEETELEEGEEEVEEEGEEEGEEEDEHHDEEEESVVSKEEEEEQDEEESEERDEGINEDDDHEEEREGVQESAEEEEGEEEHQGSQGEEEYASRELNDQTEEEEEKAEQGNVAEEDENDSRPNLDDDGVLMELNDASEEDNANVDDNEGDSQFDVSAEADEASDERKDGDVSEEFLGIPGVNEIDDDSVEPLEEIEAGEPEDDVQDMDTEPEVAEIEEESASVAVKFGVGVALVVAAHFVLVRRWNNVDFATTDDAGMPDLSRRNTIVPPAHIKQVITSSEDEEKPRTKKQTQNYEELRSTYNKLEDISTPEKAFVERAHNVKSEIAPMKNIRSTQSSAVEEVSSIRGQSKVISSEEEDDEELETSEGERVSGTEEYDEEDEEEEEEEDEEIDNVDDSELIAKLEAKYGKLPTPQDSEEEQEDEEEEEEEDEGEEEEEIEEDEDIAGWKRVRAPKESAAESRSTVKVSDKTETKAKQESSAKTRSGPKVHDSILSNNDDVIVHEENEYGMYQEFDN